MQLWSQINLWEYHHPEAVDFYHDFDIDTRLDRETLQWAIMAELGELETICHTSEELHWRMALFFKKWNIPIKELLNTLEYDYDPMINVDYQVQRNLGKQVARELGRDIIRDLVSAIKTKLDSTLSNDSTRKITDTYSDNVDNTHSDDTHTSKSGNRALDETDRHYVSAYNQITPADADTYSDRDTIDRDETYSETEDVGNDGTWNQKKTSTDNTDDTLDETKTTDSSQAQDRTDKETTNTDENESTRTDEDEGTHKVGMDGITHQELIDSQRDTVQFNLYNWIVDKLAREIIVGVW